MTNTTMIPKSEVLIMCLSCTTFESCTTENKDICWELGKTEGYQFDARIQDYDKMD